MYLFLGPTTILTLQLIVFFGQPCKHPADEVNQQSRLAERNRKRKGGANERADV